MNIVLIAFYWVSMILSWIPAPDNLVSYSITILLAGLNFIQELEETDTMKFQWQILNVPSALRACDVYEIVHNMLYICSHVHHWRTKLIWVSHLGPEVSEKTPRHGNSQLSSACYTAVSKVQSCCVHIMVDGNAQHLTHILFLLIGREHVVCVSL